MKTVNEDLGAEIKPHANQVLSWCMDILYSFEFINTFSFFLMTHPL